MLLRLWWCYRWMSAQLVHRCLSWQHRPSVRRWLQHCWDSAFPGRSSPCDTPEAIDVYHHCPLFDHKKLHLECVLLVHSPHSLMIGPSVFCPHQSLCRFLSITELLHLFDAPAWLDPWFLFLAPNKQLNLVKSALSFETVMSHVVLAALLWYLWGAKGRSPAYEDEDEPSVRHTMYILCLYYVPPVECTYGIPQCTCF